MATRPDLRGLSRCFQPRQWFPHGFDDVGGTKIMYVYQPSDDGKWVVGFFCPDGTWVSEGVFDNQEAAAARVNWLNGGLGH